MPNKKMKLEFYDDSGIKHIIAIEGNVSKDKMSQILDYVELMGGASSDDSKHISNKLDRDNKFDRVRTLVLSEFNDKVFSSKEIQFTYFNSFGENIPLSTVSTYLSRLVDRGFLNRGGSSGDWRYAVAYKKEKIFH